MLLLFLRGYGCYVNVLIWPFWTSEMWRLYYILAFKPNIRQTKISKNRSGVHKTSYNFCFIRDRIIALRRFVAERLTWLAAPSGVWGCGFDSVLGHRFREKFLRLELSHVNTWILGKVRQANQLKSVGATCRGVPCINNIRGQWLRQWWW